MLFFSTASKAMKDAGIAYSEVEQAVVGYAYGEGRVHRILSKSTHQLYMS